MTTIAKRNISTSDSSVYNVIAFFRIYNDFYFIPIAIIFSCACCYLIISIVLKKRGQNIVSVLVTSTSGYALFTFLVQRIPMICFLGYLTMSAIVLALLNVKWSTLSNRFYNLTRICSYVFICIPFFAELFFPYQTISSMQRKSSPPQLHNNILTRLSSLYTFNAISISLFYILTIGAINASWIPDNTTGDAEQINNGDFYSLQINKEKNQLIVSNIRNSNLEIYNIFDHPFKLYEIPLLSKEVQDVRINSERNELYHFDREDNKMIVLDLDDFSQEKESKYFLQGEGSARIAFDNNTNTIALSREEDYVWILDMKTTQPMQKLNIGTFNEFILFNKKRNEYILSYFGKYPFLRTVSSDGKKITHVDSMEYQGGIALSNQHNELFVALPLQSKILVYDLLSLKQKRFIPTVFGVRSIAYDKTHDILIAASMCNGYVHTIDRSTGKGLEKFFVGYYLREICIDENKRDAYISSRIGGLYRLSY